MPSINFSDISLSLIVVACCNIRQLIFDDWEFNLQTSIDFSGPLFKIKDLSLRGCGTSYSNNWPSRPEKLQNLISAIGKSSLRDSLEEITVYGCGLNRKQVKKMLKKYNIINIYVYSEC